MNGLTLSVKRPMLMASLVLCAVIVTLYSVSLGHNFLFDEENIILSNPYLKDLSFLPELFKRGFFYFQGRAKPLWTEYYRPLTSVTFAVNYYFFKGNPLGYNLTNLFLHCGVVLLFFRLLLKAYKNVWVAFLCAMLYAVHTIHVEAVTYIASRSDLLSGALLLTTLLCYWNAWPLGALLAFGLSLFVKESMILIPVYLFFLEGCFIKSPWRRALSRLGPFALLMALFILYRRLLCPIPLGPSSINPRDAGLRFLSMGPAFLSYLQTLVSPEIFKFSQTVRFAQHFSDAQVLTTVVILISLFLLWLVLFKYKAGGFFGLNLFLISLLPSMQIVPYYPEWAEHYLYIPFMGVVILAGEFLKGVLESSRKWRVFFFILVYLPFVLFLCHRTLQRNQFYNDAKTFYQALAASDSPYNYYGYQNLARLLIENGDWDGALTPLKTALKISPYSDMVHQLLGRYYMEKKNYAEALKSYQRASAIDPDNNEFRMNVGNALMSLERYDEAAKAFEDIQKRNPKYYFVYINLIASHELAGRPEKALEWGKRGIKAASGKKMEEAFLTASLIRLAYRERWEAVTKAYIQTMLQKYPELPWYAEVSKLLAGQMDADEFLKTAHARYGGFEFSAKNYVLMSYVLGHRTEKIPSFLKENRDQIEKSSKARPLFLKEVQRAEDAAKDVK